MHDVGLVLQQVVDALNDTPFPQHYLVPHTHEPVLHVSLQPMHEVYSMVEQALEQFLLDISPVGKDLSIEFPCKHAPYTFVPVINVCTCKTERYDVSAVIAQKVQLETVAPSHRPLAVLRNSVEDLVGIAPQIMAHRYHGGVHKAYSAAFSKGLEFHEKHHVQKHARHEFNEAVVRHGIRKVTGEVLPDIEKIVVLEIGE